MKRFKFLVMSLVLVTCLIGSQATISASSYSTGKAVIPYYIQEETFYTWCTVSNITDAPINVTVTLYDTDGTVLTDDNSISTGLIQGEGLLNYNDQRNDSTVTFILNAHCTGIFRVRHETTDRNYGYGIIKWDQEGNALQGLVATCHEGGRYPDGERTRDSIPINNGMPF
jgi:hypothetical protein